MPYWNDVTCLVMSCCCCCHSDVCLGGWRQIPLWPSIYHFKADFLLCLVVYFAVEFSDVRLGTGADGPVAWGWGTCERN